MFSPSGGLLLSLVNSSTQALAEGTRHLVLGISPPLLPVEMLDFSHGSFQLSVPAVLQTIGQTRYEMTGSMRCLWGLGICDVSQDV